MRVGAGGIMLPNHNPLRVVEIFRTLEALHPGRVDLGLGRAPGTDPVTAAALRRGPADDPNDRLAELLAFANSTFPEGHPYRNVVPMPSDVSLPTIWMLGSTLEGASIAASLGVRYAFAGHFAMRNAKAAIAGPGSVQDVTRAGHALRHARGHGRLRRNDDEAERMAAPIRLAVVRNRTGRRAPIASVDEALAYRFTPEEEAIAGEFLRGAIIGGPQRVLDGLASLARDTRADELMLSTLLPDREERAAVLRESLARCGSVGERCHAGQRGRLATIRAGSD